MTPTKQRTETDFLCLTISTTSPTTIDKWDAERYAFKVRVQSDATHKTITFDFYGSQYDYEHGVSQLDHNGLLEAFRCFVCDAQAAEQDYDDFCSEFGYEQDIESKRIWNACKSSARKFRSLWHDLRDADRVLDLLAAEGIE